MFMTFFTAVDNFIEYSTFIKDVQSSKSMCNVSQPGMITDEEVDRIPNNSCVVAAQSLVDVPMPWTILGQEKPVYK